MSIVCEFNSVEEWLDELRHAKRFQRLELLPVRASIEWRRSERLPIVHISVLASFIADLGVIHRLRRYVGDDFGPQNKAEETESAKKARQILQVIREAAAELELEVRQGAYTFELAK